MLNSLFTFLNNILSSSGSQTFVFLIFTFVNICQNEVLVKKGNFPGDNFPRGSLMGGNFRVGIFLGGICLEPTSSDM